MDPKLERIVRSLAGHGEGDVQGHASIAIDSVCSAADLSAREVRDLVELNSQLFDPALTRKPASGIVALGLSIDGRQAAHDLGVELPSPFEDAKPLLDRLGKEATNGQLESAQLCVALGWGQNRLADAATVLHQSGDANVEQLAGKFLVALNPKGRRTIEASENPDIYTSGTPRSTFLVGFGADGGGVGWQALNGPPDEDFVQVTFEIPSRERATKRRTVEAVYRLITPESVPWLVAGKRTWKVNVPLLQTAFPWLLDYGWLGNADIEVEPEFEDREREVFGRLRFSGRVLLRITPDIAVPVTLPEAARQKILVFHGPDNASKFELLAWLRGHDVQADARTVGEMPAHSRDSVDVRVQQAIDWADKAIAIVSPDDRSPAAAPNVIDEIGRWRGGNRQADLAIARHRACADIWSNLAGVVRLEYDERVKETFLGLAKFLGILGPRVSR